MKNKSYTSGDSVVALAVTCCLGAGGLLSAIAITRLLIDLF